MRLTQNNTSSGREYLMIILVTAIFAAFMVWANYTQLDLVTRGSGRVIADGQNKNVQSPERGTIATYVVEEGSSVSVGQVIATINPIEAEGVLQESWPLQLYVLLHYLLKPANLLLNSWESTEWISK